MSDYIAQMRAKGRFPAVLRYERMGPQELRKMIKHAKPEVRKNLRHIDAARTHLNHTPIGSIEDLQELFRVTKELAEFNQQSNAMGLRKINRPTLAEQVEKGRPQDPWDPKALPWRQAIVSVNSDWMLADPDCPKDHVLEYLKGDGVLVRVDRRKGKELEEAFDSWLQEEHGEALRYLRWDWDEDGLHGHAAIAHLQEYEPSDRYAEGRWHWRPSVHPHFRNELAEDGRRERTGYEVAQDSIGSFFARPEWAHMNIVRGEPKAAKCRQAERAGDDLIADAEGAAFVGLGEELPSGSRNAQAMFLLKKRMADAVEEKGSAEKVKTDHRQTMALDLLEMIGAISTETRNEASTRRARQALLDQHEAAYGTAAEIITAPDLVVAKAAAELKAQKEAAEAERQRLDKAAAEARRREDEAARIERSRLDKEAAEARAAKDRQIDKREEKLVVREVEIERKAQWVVEALRVMNDLGSKIREAAIKTGLIENPVVQSGLAAYERLKDWNAKRGRERTR